jgi:hypothetical protein
MLGKDIEHPPESRSAAIFEDVLDEGVAAGDRRNADNFRRQIDF